MFVEENHDKLLTLYWCTPMGLVDLDRGGYLFCRELGSTGNYFRGAGEQAHNFGDLGSPAQK